ncbi:MAG: MarR family winged helix-turn-helix transcriptional regulator [Micromonosporaceae bacterium]
MPSTDFDLSISDQVDRTAKEYGPDFDPTVLALTLTLYRTMTVLDRAHAAELAPHRLTLSQFNILNVLHRAAKPLTMGELGQAVSVRPANLTGVIDTLAKRSLVERELNPDDRRSFLVGITDAGEEFLGRFLPRHWRYLEALTSGLTERQRTQLTGLLDRLHDSVQAAELTAAESSGVTESTDASPALAPGS